MDLAFRPELAAGYRGPTQRIRVLSEAWVRGNLYCPQCGAAPITSQANNRPVLDFRCDNCGEDFELKSQGVPFGSRITDGAYGTMMQRLREQKVPNLLLLRYAKSDLRVHDVVVVPKQFFVPDIIEARPPLGASARRAGWIGCKIVLGSVPAAGRIAVIAKSVPQPQAVVLEEWRKTLFLREAKDDMQRGWLLAVMRCIEPFGARVFTLDEVYVHEPALAQRFPQNSHVRAKIRQQLQRLRDQGYLSFFGRGAYRRR